MPFVPYKNQAPRPSEANPPPEQPAAAPKAASAPALPRKTGGFLGINKKQNIFTRLQGDAKSLAQKASERFAEMVKATPKIQDLAKHPLQALNPSPAIQIAGAGAGLANDVIGQAATSGVRETSRLESHLQSAVNPAMTAEQIQQDRNKGMKEIGGAIKQAAVATGVTDQAARAMAEYNKLKLAHPEIAKDLEASGNILALITNFVGGEEGAAAAGAVADTAGEGIQTGARSALEAIPKPPNPIAMISKDIAGGAQALSESGVGASVRRIAEGGGNLIKRAGENLQEFGKGSKELYQKAPEYIKAFQADLPKETLDHIANLSTEGKKAVGEMVSLVGKNEGALLKTPPKQIVGKIIVKATEPVIKAKKAAGEALGALRKTFTSEKTVDASKLRDSLMKTLVEDAGVKIDPKTEALDFSRSRIPEGDQKLYEDVMKAVQSGKVSQKEIDNASAQLFSQFNQAKSRLQPFSSEADTFLGKFRSGVGELLGPQYQKQAKKYAETITHLHDVAKTLGLKEGLNMESLTAKELKAAEVAARAGGNAAQVPKEFIASVQQMAKRFGSKAANELPEINQLADHLEKIFGTTQEKGIEGTVARGAASAAAKRSGPKLGGAIVGPALEALQTMGSVSKKEQQQALADYIKHLIAGGK